MNKKDWGWWDRLADEYKQRSHPAYAGMASFEAWDDVIRNHIVGGWFDALEFWERVELYNAMCALREHCQEE